MAWKIFQKSTFKRKLFGCVKETDFFAVHDVVVSVTVLVVGLGQGADRGMWREWFWRYTVATLKGDEPPIVKVFSSTAKTGFQEAYVMAFNGHHRFLAAIRNFLVSILTLYTTNNFKSQKQSCLQQNHFWWQSANISWKWCVCVWTEEN